MANVFYTIKCLDESKKINRTEIHKELFEKKTDGRQQDQAQYIQRLIALNRDVLDFLGIRIESHDTGKNYYVKFISDRYIGAVPIRMPYDGVVHSDFIVKPRYQSKDEGLKEITELIAQIGYDVSPEFMEDRPLKSADAARPPLYYEAAKYVDYLYEAKRFTWHKFQKEYRINSFPKSSTDWNRYALMSADPKKALLYPCNDNVLSQNHLEWRMLKYAYLLAKEELLAARTPIGIRFRYQSMLGELDKGLATIAVQKASTIKVRSTDPMVIKRLKEQANVVLSQNTTVTNAWRIDIAELFERYTQYIIKQAVKELGGSVFANSKISGHNSIPPWGLKYLEPDTTVKIGDSIIFVDAKYKANMYSINNNSKKLKETHREDLHQVLSYCSFSNEANKVGVIMYPAEDFMKREISYSNRLSGVENRIFLVGLPFKCDKISEAKEGSKKLFLEILNREE